MISYRHAQIGYLLIGSLGFLLLISIALLFASGFSSVFVVTTIAYSVALAMFSTLTVVIEDHFVVAEFTFGIPRRPLYLGNVVNCRIVQPPWYYGWGIRYTPRGWLYRVSGFSAVEIEVTSGRHFTIGSDEPDVLVEAIERARGVTPSGIPNIDF